MNLPAEQQAVTGSLPLVLSVAFPFAVVGPAAVGGAEVVLSQLEASLPTVGFGSLVVAREGSQPLGQLYPTVVPEGEIDDALRTVVEAAHQANINRALAEHPVALVHMHGLDFHRYRLPLDLPVLVTLHLPPAWYPEAIWDLPANYHLLCVSETQRRACPSHAQGRLQVIGNGVPLPDRATLRPGGRYALMLARICPEKNLHMGFDAARLAGLPAMLGGEIFPYREHLRYFAEQIEPRLTVSPAQHTQRGQRTDAVPDARFLGPVSGTAKARLLSRAACLLLPSLAPETSSLVAMEALAAGVPVIAVASGAVPELVEHGRTGLLVEPGGDIVANLAAALAQVPSLSRPLCRETAEARFALSRMLQEYAAQYRRLRLPAPVAAAPQGASTPGCGSEPAGKNPSVEQAAACLKENDLQLRHFQGVAALEALQAAWVDLWQADPSATPFQHPAWLLPWARHFGPDGRVHALALHEEAGRPVGLLPLFTYTEAATPTRPEIRKLLLLGTGTSDYLGGVFLPGSGTMLPGTALRAALQASPAWDSLDLLQLRADSPLLRASGQLPAFEKRAAEPCAVLQVDRPLPAKIGINVRRYGRLAAACGTLTCHVAATAKEAGESFDHLVRLHGDRWKARDEEGVLGDERVLRHHREALPALLEAGLLRLFRLQNGPLGDAEPWAVLYALADPPHRRQRRLYLYLIGMDTRFSAFSPGTLIMDEVLEYARREGFSQLDLLRGGEEYKRFWGAVAEPTFALHADPTPR